MGMDPITAMLMGQMSKGGGASGPMDNAGPIFGPPDKKDIKSAGNVAGDASGLTSALPKARGMGLPF